ncbi:UMP kinase [Candidatus Woesearchaeota archaeon]|nr:UMP kinase [Candidatus Woesearchaeota archaeon]
MYMETIILSLGGSIICPDKPDYFFLKDFKNFVISGLDRYRFIIVCGGGKTNSYYNEAAARVSNIKKEDLDWIGIMATRLNAELVRSIFGELAYEKVIHGPEKEIKTDRKIILASGWKPGRSTDYVAVLLAKQLKVKVVVNMTNISYIYTKDPKKHPDAEKLFEVSWKDYRKIVGNRWSPRMNSPFDPVASREAQKMKLEVAVLNGTDLKNVEAYLSGNLFKGTIIK